MIAISKEEIIKIETARYCKIEKNLERKINRFLKENTTFPFELI